MLFHGSGLGHRQLRGRRDGVTLNYVVLVPLFDGGEMTGSLFVSLYFDDMVRILAESAVGPDVGSVLIGSRGQTMSPRRVSCTTTCSSTRFAAASRSV